MSDRKGRPAGSPNLKYQDVHEIPAACVSCGSVKLTRIAGSKSLSDSVAGELGNGFKFSRVVRTRKRCECGQVLIVRTYFPQN